MTVTDIAPAAASSAPIVIANDHIDSSNAYELTNTVLEQLGDSHDGQLAASVHTDCARDGLETARTGDALSTEAADHVDALHDSTSQAAPSNARSIGRGPTRGPPGDLGVALSGCYCDGLHCGVGGCCGTCGDIIIADGTSDEVWGGDIVLDDTTLARTIYGSVVIDGCPVGGGPLGCPVICGDGILAGDEECDDGNTVTEVCTYGETSCTVCAADCTITAGVTSYCGDSVADATYETCDDGNTVTEACAYGETSCTVCAADCTEAAGSTSYCGDSIVDAANAETCDDGNAVTDSCAYGLTSCTVCGDVCTAVAGPTSYCGDGVLDAAAGEGCDDGAANSDDDPDACRTSCVPAACGDGVVDFGEVCDDANKRDGDTCSADCLDARPMISAGHGHTCEVIAVTNEVHCWGWNNMGQAAAPSGKFSAVAAGNQHTCGLRFDGTIECWGDPAVIPPSGAFVELSASVVPSNATFEDRGCGIRTDGSVECWGGLWSYQPEGTFNQVSLTGDKACGIKSDGSLDCWYDFSDAPEPPMDFVTPPYERITTNLGTGLVTTGGALEYKGCYGWSNCVDYYEVGSFVDVASTMALQWCAVDAAQEIQCWQDAEADVWPTPVTGPVEQLTCGGRHCCAVVDGADTVCWGSNEYHQLDDSPGEGQVCDSSADCPADAPICGAATGQCHDGSVDDKCTSDSECGPSAPQCRATGYPWGFCQVGEDGDRCNDASDCSASAPICSPELYCRDGLLGDECLTDADCAASWVCDAGSCAGIPPSPDTVAPPFDSRTSQPFADTVTFLYEGGIQAELDESVLDGSRVAVVRGRVLDGDDCATDCAPLPGARISIKDHPEYGYTISRNDGAFDLVINGGGSFVVSYEIPERIPVHRRIDVPWNRFATTDDVVMIPFDPTVTAIAPGSASAQFHRSATTTDADGSRRAVILFPPATTAQMTFADGTTAPLDTAMHVRATEFTVGAMGPAQMPAALPPSSAYTYALELSVDEANDAGAIGVEFSQPVFVYVDNFLEFPVGAAIPVGFYDRQLGAWVPEPNGTILEILRVESGSAVVALSTAGVDATPEELADLGIEPDELQALGDEVTTGEYAVGDTLWRVPTLHFSPYDYNVAFVLPPDAAAPKSVVKTPKQVACETQVAGSIVGCHNQTLGELVSIAGSPVALRYQSDRVPGHTANRTLHIDLAPATAPPSAERIYLEVSVAGRVLREDFDPSTAGGTATTTTLCSPLADGVCTFEWDGQDVYGRSSYGAQPVVVRVGYEYQPEYASTLGFGAFSELAFPVTRTRIGQTYTWWKTDETTLDGARDPSSTIGGWSITAHHRLDRLSGTLELGSGQRRRAGDGAEAVVRTLAGSGLSRGSSAPTDGDGGPATAATLSRVWTAAQAPDGAIYLGEERSIRRIDPDGTINTVVPFNACSGTGSTYYACGDGGAAANAGVHPVAMEATEDGSLYFLDVQGHSAPPFCDNNHRRIRRIRPDGIIEGVAGVSSFNAPMADSDGKLATDTYISDATDFALAPDGSIFFVEDYSNNCEQFDNHSFFQNGGAVRRIGTDGIVTTIAGAYQRKSPRGDGGPAADAALLRPSGIDIGPDGSLYIADWLDRRVRRIDPSGRITTVAGGGSTPPSSSGSIPATDAELRRPEDVVVISDGTLFIVQHAGKPAGNGTIPVEGDSEIFMVDTEGRLTHVAGIPGVAFAGEDAPPLSAVFSGWISASVARDDSLLVADTAFYRLRRIGPGSLAELPAGEVTVPGGGSVAYRFDANGRHLETLDTHSGDAVLQFGYDANGDLSTLTDSEGRVTTIERSAGTPTAIVGPFGHRTELGLNADGFLELVTGPDAAQWRFGYDGAEGLLTSVTNPRQRAYENAGGSLADPDNDTGQPVSIEYYDDGRLEWDKHVEGGTLSLARAETEFGHEVTMTSPEGRISTHWYESLPDGTTTTGTTWADGWSSSTVRRPDGSVASASSDGTVSELLMTPDPRWGMDTPVPASQTTTFPSGLSMTITTSIDELTANPANPLEVTRVVTSTTINDAPEAAQTVWDAATSTVTSTSREGRTSVATLNADDRVSRIEIPGSELAPIDLTYDAGRVATVSQGTGATERVSTIAYDPVTGYPTSVTDAEGGVVSFEEYDEVGRPRRVRLPGEVDRLLLVDYDEHGNVRSIQPPGRDPHTRTFTPLDLLESETWPEVLIGGDPDKPEPATTTYQYNMDRQLEDITWPDGQVTDFLYDATTGRLEDIEIRASSDPASVTDTYDVVYDTEGRVDRIDMMTAGAAMPETLAFAYDGSLVTSTSWTGNVTGSVSVAYNDELQVYRQTVNGDEVDYLYDLDGALDGVGPELFDDTGTRTATAPLLDVLRHPLTGAVDDVQMSGLGAFIQTRVYDPDGDGAVRNEHGEVIDIYTQVNGLAKYTAHYERDKLGRITTLIENIEGEDRYFEYRYDAAGRLDQVKEGTNSADAQVIAIYGYDANGNRTYFEDPRPTGGIIDASQITIDARDRLTKYGNELVFTWTSNGHLATKERSDQITTFTYDVQGSLRAVVLPDGTPIEYIVDPAGRRIAKKVDGAIVKRWIYQDALNPVLEIDETGATPVTTRFVYATRGHVPDYMIKNGVTYRIITDHLGSPRLVINATDGSIAQRLDYDAWGNITNDSPPDFQPFAFAGGLYDQHTNLLRFGARDYDPEVGRWTAADPIGFAGGDPNLYAYVAGNPVNVTDPSGLDATHDAGEFIRKCAQNPAVCATITGLGGYALAEFLKGISGGLAHGAGAAEASGWLARVLGAIGRFAKAPKNFGRGVGGGFFIGCISNIPACAGAVAMFAGGHHVLELDLYFHQSWAFRPNLSNVGHGVADNAPANLDCVRDRRVPQWWYDQRGIDTIGPLSGPTLPVLPHTWRR